MRQICIEKYGLSGHENLSDGNESILGNQPGLQSFGRSPLSFCYSVRPPATSPHPLSWAAPAPPHLHTCPASAGREWGERTSMAWQGVEK